MRRLVWFRKVSGLGSALLAMLVCAGALSALPPARTGTRSLASGAGNAAVADAALQKEIEKRFARSKISVNNFQIKVQAGVATIEGRTGVIQHKGTATRLAKAAGAKQVLNRVQVSEEARQRASANLAKGRRRAQLKRGEARADRK